MSDIVIEFEVQSMNVLQFCSTIWASSVCRLYIEVKVNTYMYIYCIEVSFIPGVE